MEIVIALTTDSEKEAWDKLYRLWMNNDGHPWDMAEVDRMEAPLQTEHKYCVFRKVR